MHIGIRAFGASLALAGAVTAGTIHTADAATAVSLSAIHRTIDRAVVADVSHNYGLGVTSAQCWGTGTGMIACMLYGPHHVRAIGYGTAYPNGRGGIAVGMVYR